MAIKALEEGIVWPKICLCLTYMTVVTCFLTVVSTAYEMSKNKFRELRKDQSCPTHDNLIWKKILISLLLIYTPGFYKYLIAVRQRGEGNINRS